MPRLRGKKTASQESLHDNEEIENADNFNDTIIDENQGAHGGGGENPALAQLQELARSLRRKIDMEKAQREKREQSLKEKLQQMETEFHRSLATTEEVHRLMEERNQELTNQIHALEERHDQFRNRFDPALEIRSRKSQIKYILPEFQGDSCPMRYLNALKKYCEAVKPTQEEMQYLLDKSLQGGPGNWWQVVKDEINHFSTFYQKFKERYWNEQTQHEVRKQLEFGYHKFEKGETRAEYATKLFAMAKELTPPPSTRDIVRKLSRHFHDEIKYAIIGRNIQDFSDLIELLENFDSIGTSNQRLSTRNWQVSSTSNSKQPNQMQQSQLQSQQQVQQQQQRQTSSSMGATNGANKNYPNNGQNKPAAFQNWRNPNSSGNNNRVNHQQGGYRLRSLETEDNELDQPQEEGENMTPTSGEEN